MTEFNMYNNDLLYWTHEDKEYCLHVQQDEAPISPREYETLAQMFCIRNTYGVGDKTGETLIDLWVEIIKENVPASVIAERLRTKYLGETYQTVVLLLKEYGENFDEQNATDNDIANAFLDVIQNVHYGIEWAKRMVTDYVAYLPLWLYSHSGISISCGDNTYPYDPFDSFRIGYIVMTKSQALQLYTSEKGADGNTVTYADSRNITRTITQVTEQNWHAVAIKEMQQEIKIYDMYLQDDVYWYTLKRRVTPAKKDIRTSHEEDWEDIESVSDFYGSNILENGLADSVGLGLTETILSKNYRTGTAAKQTIVYYQYIEHAPENNDKERKSKNEND